MSAKLRQLYAKKEEAFKACRAILDKADEEGRELTAEEQVQYHEAEIDMDNANDGIDREKKLIAAEKELQASREIEPGQLQQEQHEEAVDRRSLLDKARAMAEEGMERKDIIKALGSDNSKADLQKSFRRYLRGGGSEAYTNLPEYAALQQDSDAGGGFLVAPEQFVARLIQSLDNMVWFRQFATVFMVSGAESIGVPTLDTDISDTNWTTELAIGTADTSMAFGKRRLTPHPLAKSIKVSKDLLRSAAIGVEGLVRERMAYKFGTVQETAFMTGSGSGQPLGVFTASGNGISTGQDVSTDNTTTAFTADGLIEAKYTLAPPYQASPSLRWIFHRDGVKMARKLKDGDGQYIWQPGLRGDATDTILNVPVLQSEYAPNTFTTGLYVGLIGDLSYYWIADAMDLDIQRLVELYAATNEDGFIGRLKADGMPVHESAFARVTLA